MERRHLCGESSDVWLHERQTLQRGTSHMHELGIFSRYHIADYYNQLSQKTHNDLDKWINKTINTAQESCKFRAVSQGKTKRCPSIYIPSPNKIYKLHYTHRHCNHWHSK
ncbi:PREDICTED: uncharacterized protein LOC107356309 [Acropora digitifera]|uniref:uncharacterized protein LOC107356309 n=1 Tax=Acropora digitifera TaxID=70779 RepID=UPI00077ABFC4|nr:PREDICTED: uncharacterized protein LOC107356309 [Acropora digitifera]